MKFNLPVDALIFDMDGVLVDVSDSYRQAITKTVDLFFTTGLGMSFTGQAQSLIDPADIDALKMAGGLNNDWDLTTVFIAYFLEMLPSLTTPTYPLRRHVPAMLAYLQMAGGGRMSVSLNALRHKKNIPELARRLAANGGGLAAVDRVLTHRNRHLLMTGGDVLTGNLIQRIFQELYLGSALFEKIYGEKPVVAQTSGFIHHETALIDPAVLEALHAVLPLGIATGRPKIEAEYTLAHLGLNRYFQAVVAWDDVLAADAEGKPDPWSLLEAARRLHPTPARSAYIGDTPDDIRVAKAANTIVPFLGIGVLAATADAATLRRQFEALQADIILTHPNRLKELIVR